MDIGSVDRLFHGTVLVALLMIGNSPYLLNSTVFVILHALVDKYGPLIGIHYGLFGLVGSVVSALFLWKPLILRKNLLSWTAVSLAIGIVMGFVFAFEWRSGENVVYATAAAGGITAAVLIPAGLLFAERMLFLSKNDGRYENAANSVGHGLCGVIATILGLSNPPVVIIFIIATLFLVFAVVSALGLYRLSGRHKQAVAEKLSRGIGKEEVAEDGLNRQSVEAEKDDPAKLSVYSSLLSSSSMSLEDAYQGTLIRMSKAAALAQGGPSGFTSKQPLLVIFGSVFLGYITVPGLFPILGFRGTSLLYFSSSFLVGNIIGRIIAFAKPPLNMVVGLCIQAVLFCMFFVLAEKWPNVPLFAIIVAVFSLLNGLLVTECALRSDRVHIGVVVQLATVCGVLTQFIISLKVHKAG